MDDDAHEVDSYTTDNQCMSHDGATCRNDSLMSSCRSISRSLQSTERSSIMGRVTTLWSKYAVALNDIEHVHIDSHKIVKCADARRLSTVAYSMDVYLAVAELGIYDHWTSRQPHYQVQHRYSDCRTLRLSLITSVLDAHRDQSCEFCKCMFNFFVSFPFPKRWPKVLVQTVPGWHSLLIRCRKQG
ncbi:hypothetical protein AaE_000281 [Aphanomyces astaci]|uniref:Uncharacterized protein n=1 Tax=Aphanomyces astaci TaxID=112090 RepID=A0A6A5AZS0_APHAT|nr:hypothetical protein AaE_000281 [Aphanomyces astaci]